AGCRCVRSERADGFIPAAVDTHLSAVIAGLDPAIHLLERSASFRWMPGSSPGMTSREQRPLVLDRSNHIACYHPGGIRPPTSGCEHVDWSVDEPCRAFARGCRALHRRKSRGAIGFAILRRQTDNV